MSELPALPATALKIGGINAFSTTDYPGKLATTIFIQGCPWRCRYCHNTHLQERTAASVMDWEALLIFLRRRLGFIDVVVFSGGEPCMDPALPAAILAIKELGFAIGLHTAGIYPRQLRTILPFIDWVGLDIKAELADYPRVTQVEKSGSSILPSLEAILESGVSYECRTTLHPDLINEEELMQLARQLRLWGVEHYALQQFRATGCHDQALIHHTSPTFPSAAHLDELATYFKQFQFRRHSE